MEAFGMRAFCVTSAAPTAEPRTAFSRVLAHVREASMELQMGRIKLKRDV